MASGFPQELLCTQSPSPEVPETWQSLPCPLLVIDVPTWDISDSLGEDADKRDRGQRLLEQLLESEGGGGLRLFSRVKHFLHEW